MKFFVRLLLALIMPSAIWSQASLPVNKTSSWGTVSTGWTHTNTGTYNTNCSGSTETAGSGQFDNTGDAYTIQYNAAAGDLSVDFKEEGGGCSYTVTVSESSNGSTYTTLASLSAADIPGSCASYSYPLSSTSRYVRISFTKTACNIRVDNLSISAAAPVELQNFNVNLENNFASYLTWHTATEQNNAYFSIERSADGQNFREIGQVAGAGTTQTEQRYTFTDEQPLRGLNYYRLKQVDFDGRFTYSMTRSVKVGQTGYVSVYPTPATDKATIQLEKATETPVNYEVFDAAGRLVLKGIFEAESDIHELDVRTLVQGVYILRLTSEREAMTKQFRKL